jgi:hypothetical protein
MIAATFQAAANAPPLKGEKGPDGKRGPPPETPPVPPMPEQLQARNRRRLFFFQKCCHHKYDHIAKPRNIEFFSHLPLFSILSNLILIHLSALIAAENRFFVSSANMVNLSHRSRLKTASHVESRAQIVVYNHFLFFVIFFAFHAVVIYRVTLPGGLHFGCCRTDDTLTTTLLTLVRITDERYSASKGTLM